MEAIKDSVLYDKQFSEYCINHISQSLQQRIVYLLGIKYDKLVESFDYKVRNTVIDIKTFISELE